MRLTTSNPPIGDGRAAAAGRDDDVALAGDGRQRHDAVEPEEGDAHAVQIATYRNKSVESLVIDLLCVPILARA